MDNIYTNLKIILLGDSCVGKTSIINKYCKNTYDENYTSTIGVDYKIKYITLDNKKIKVNIWDTAGQERFRSIIRSYYKKTNIIILCYDTTNFRTYNNIQIWLDDIIKYKEDYGKIYIIGNKIDLNREFDINNKNKYNLNHYYISAKTSNNLNETMNEIINNYISEYKDKIVLDKKQSFELISIDNKKSNNCC